MDFEYLKTEYDSLVLDKEDLNKTLNIASKIAHINSASIECNSLSFIPDWMHRTLTLTITNDLTYFKNKVELLGDINKSLKDVFSIKIETLNKLRPYFRDKILIYKKDTNYYIRLIDGDLLLNVNVPNMNKLAFTSSDASIIYETKVGYLCKLLNYYKNMSDDYSDKWITFDGEKISLCGLNFYAETEIRTPIMCLLMTDVELLLKLDQYYSEESLLILSTDSSIPKLHIKVANIEIEILNVTSNINRNNISKLNSFIADSNYEIDPEALKRVLNIAISLNDINKDCIIQSINDNIVVILNDNKGVSKFNLVTSKLEKSPEVNETKLNVNTLYKIINCSSEDTTKIALNKIYTTICNNDIKAIILNK